MTIRKSNKNDNRRVSFKNAGSFQKNASSLQMKLKKKYVEQSLRTQIEEDDERMVDFDPHKTTFRRRNSPIPGSARNNKAKGLIESGAGWYQVTVSLGLLQQKSVQILIFLCSFPTDYAWVKIR